MLNRLDDYPIHQTPEPLASPQSGDRNFYDRYFANGYTREGDVYFAAAMGLYPNRRVQDAAFSIVHEGRQYVVRASRLAPLERTETTAGPISFQVLEPMRTMRLHVAPNDFGVEADLLFRLRTVAVEEPRYTHRVAGRISMDSTRFTQFGTWEGWISIHGTRLPVEPSRVPGLRDRSWGIRPVGEREQGAPSPAEPQFFWLWCPVQFDDLCTHFMVNETGDGRPWQASGCRVRVPRSSDEIDPTSEADVERMLSVAHRVQWRPGTRRAERAELTLSPLGEDPFSIQLEPILTFQMLGLGYLHPEWGHGMWKGELAVDGETYDLPKLEPLDPRHLHVQQLCTARMGDRTGIAVFEQLVIGRHTPSGFRSLLDGAP